MESKSSQTMGYDGRVAGFDDLPNWKFYVFEVGYGLCRMYATDDGGNRMEMHGTIFDDEKLLEWAHQAILQFEKFGFRMEPAMLANVYTYEDP